MVLVADGKLVFSRDQVVSSTQASKNFGEMRRRVRDNPVFVADRKDGIDTVIVSFDQFERMACELEKLRDERLYAVASARVAEADADPHHLPITLSDALGADAASEIYALDGEAASDEELFE